ncbi:MAG: hypothetical protein HND27_05770 [Bacteroidetes bacterium]|nr:hypothetical protein [Bacteroidota bacterium]MCL4816109.1 hypothetical protein [Flavobacteriales bacterium]NOG95268.1 hypothetical protein [Bacteroidota bacterium]WKZ74886.1 MAG: hypothetical protein QY303_12150 [Vicingaceae bacterium]CAG0993399.1 hypothetical protein FLAV_02434 [Flavobacteriales bacterium]
MNKPSALLFFLLFVLNLSIYSQSENLEIKEEIVTPVKHWVKPAEGKNYLLWTVIEKYDNCIYLIERSSNNTDWEMIGYKDAYKSPGDIPLAYYFTDEEPLNGNNFYRLKRVILLKSASAESNPIEIITVKTN